MGADLSSGGREGGILAPAAAPSGTLARKRSAGSHEAQSGSSSLALDGILFFPPLLAPIVQPLNREFSCHFLFSRVISEICFPILLTMFLVVEPNTLEVSTVTGSNLYLFPRSEYLFLLVVSALEVAWLASTAEPFTAFTEGVNTCCVPA